MTPVRAAKMAAAVDRTFGEDITIQPMIAPSGDVNGRPVPDGSRAAMTITASFVEPQIEAARHPHPRSEGRSRDGSTGRPQAKFSAAALPYAVQRGDRVLRVATGDLFEVADPGADGFGRIVLGLTAKGS